MNDAHRHECRCGKPIHDGAHLCVATNHEEPA